MMGKSRRVWIGLLAASLALTLLGVYSPETAAAHPQSGAGMLLSQDGGPSAGEVTYDTPVQGTIDATTYQQNWTLTAQGADRIRVRVERTDGNLIPDVVILDSSDSQVVESYGADATYAVAQIDDTTLPEAGTYTLVVSRYDGESGTTTGGYQLTVTVLGMAEDNPINTAVVGAVTLDEPVTGEITAQHWAHVYTFEGQQGDMIGVTAARTSGTLVPNLSVLDNNGQSLRTGYPDNDTVTSTVDGLELPYSGQYSVIVTRNQGLYGATAGGYTLTVHLLGSGEDSERLTSVTPGTIDQYNTTVQGEITNANWYQDWQFRTVSADTITIEVRRSPDYTPDTPNVLQPDVILIDALGNELRQAYLNDDEASATIDRYTLDNAGTYTVRVQRDRGKSGETTGTYALTIVLDGVGPDSPSLTDASGEVMLGTPVTGEVTNVRWADSWTFNGQADQLIDILVERTGGTLVPHLELFDSNGQSLYMVYPEDTQDSALLESYTLPYTDVYKIVVSRDREDTGYTTGTYQLTVRASQ